MIETIWNWHPGLGLGPFRFNDNIQKYLNNYDLEKLLEETDITGWITYEVPNTDISIEVEDSLIVSISSYDYFCYKNKNVIGMELGSFIEFLSASSYEIGESVEYDDGDIQTAYEYDELGLQVWESHGVVVGAACRGTNQSEKNQDTPYQRDSEENQDTHQLNRIR